MYRNLTGFTLLELIVVVIVIGILATIAIPGYQNVVNNTREREAKTNLKLIYNAQKMFRLDKNKYSGTIAGLSDYIPDPDTEVYDYTVTDSAQVPDHTFKAQAAPKTGFTSCGKFTIDQNGTISEVTE